jgi:3-deoxy-manno-octulosonate cytidylyltransferase (CMP-KDO synthetase)
MVEHVYRRAAEARGVSRVIVATDDDRVSATVRAFGGEAVMTNAAHRSGTDRLAEVAAGLDCDLIVNVQGDEPLIEPTAIVQAISAFDAGPSLQMTTLRRRLESIDEFLSPSVVKVVVDRRGDALYFSRAPVPYGRNVATHLVPACTFKHIGLYVYRRDFLLTVAGLDPTPLEVAEALEQLRVLEHGYSIRTVETEYDSIGVDTPDDLAHVRRLAAATTMK